MPGRTGVALLLALAMGLAPTGARGDDAAPSGDWLAGDLHVHTCYSHDVWCGPSDDNTGPDEAYTAGLPVEGRFAEAAVRGLDYLAITDHNDLRAADEPGFGAHGVVGVRGYENSLDGHAQMLGAERIYPGGSGPDDVRAMRDALHDDGGAFGVNHPAEGSTDFPRDADWSYGYEIVPDTVEVWNISRLYQPPFPSASSNDDAVAYWQGWLDRGQRVAATGGSDSHWAATTAVQGPGQPTTWVFAGERTEQGVLEGLRAGRTFISFQPPALGGPLLHLEADASRDGDYEALVGDAVPPDAAFRVRVHGAPGTFLRLVVDGGEVLRDGILVRGATFSHVFDLPEGTGWVRAELYEPDLAEVRSAACDPLLGGETTYCRNALGVLAMTSAIFVDPGAAG